MRALLEIIAAVFLMIGGLIYLYKPSWVIHFNTWCRERLFSESAVLGARRRIGLLLILLACLLFYDGLSKTFPVPTAGPPAKHIKNE